MAAFILTRVLLLLVALLSSLVCNAQTTVAGVVYHTLDASCSQMKSAGNNGTVNPTLRLQVLSCSDDPLLTGSTILALKGTSLVVNAFIVATQAAPTPSDTAGIQDVPIFQAAATSWYGAHLLQGAGVSALSPEYFASLGITPADVLYVMSWGVGVVLLLFSVGVAVGAGVTAVRKV